MGCAGTEFQTIDLGDERRNKRAIRLVERLSAQPMASVPQACGDWADTMAAYRFFDNEKVDWRAILGAHTDCAKTCMAGHEVVLCIQYTTELDFNGQQASGLGPLSYEAQRGMYAHPTYAVSISREPLGVLGAWMWGREPKDKDGHRPGVKESVRWVEGYERLAGMAPQLPGTRLVYLADREADIMDVDAARVRAGHARGLAAAQMIQAPCARIHPPRNDQDSHLPDCRKTRLSRNQPSRWATYLKFIRAPMNFNFQSNYSIRIAKAAQP